MNHNKPANEKSLAGFLLVACAVCLLLGIELIIRALKNIYKFFKIKLALFKRK